MRVPLEWLKEFVDIRVKPDKLAHALTMAGLEVEAIERVGQESIFEVNVTPNRADCLSITGVARDASCALKSRLKLPVYKPPRGSGKMKEFVRIQVKSQTRCPRYAARVIDGVKIGPSPAWIVKRLAAAGVRSINNVVDATNYVMLELGQPLHAFDLRYVREGQIIVRTAGAPMVFGTLDGIERKLVAEDLLICDGSGPVAIAGVMGGENSEVRNSTTKILLESAFFEPTGVRRTSKRLGLSSESSRRFERGVDPNGALFALHRLTQIIVDSAGGTPTSDWVDLYPKKFMPRRIKLSVSEVQRILGVKVDGKKIVGLLAKLGFGVSRSKGDAISVVVPTSRCDIERPIDLIEEVARCHGYDSIPETMPTVSVRSIVRPRFSEQETIVRNSLVGAGLSEAVLYGFTSESSLEPFSEVSSGVVKIANPLSVDEAVMRTSLIPGLLDSLKTNISRQQGDCRLFALQRVYRRPMAIGPSEETRSVAGVIAGVRFPGAWERAREELDFYDAKGVVETLLDSLGLSATAIFQRGDAYKFLHPGAFAYVICGGKRVGFVGELHPDVTAKWDLERRVFAFELNFEELGESAMAISRKYSASSVFPSVERDLSIVIEDRIPSVEVEKTIWDSGIDLVERVRIFDVYRGDGVGAGRKSVGLTLRFARSDRTLTDDEVKVAQERIVSQLKKSLGAELRT